MNQRGFTLTEIMMVIAILGILTAFALPSFRQYVANQRVKSASFDLISTLSFARSEAVKRNATVDITPASGGWTNGWTISTGTTTLRSYSSYNGVTMSDSASVTKLSYGVDGRVSGTTTNFSIAPSSSITGVTSRCVKVNLSGKASSLTGSCS